MFEEFIPPIVQQILLSLQQIILPFICILCGQKTQESLDLCAACLADLPPLLNPCSRCAKPDINKRVFSICHSCIYNPPSFNRSYCLFSYKTPIPSLLSKLQWHNNLVYAKIFGEIIAAHLQQRWINLDPPPEIIIPIPKPATYLKTRGYNPAVEIARPISKILNLPLINHYKQQCYQNIAIVSDILLTGETCNTFSHTLKQHGAKYIDIWCIARC